MRIEYKITLSDIRNNYIQFFLRELRKRNILFIIAPCLLYLFIDLEKDLIEYIIYTFIIELILLLLISVPFAFSYRKILRKIKEKPGFYNNKTIELEESGINLYSENKSQILVWEAIYSLEMNDKYISIILADKSFILIPVHSFSNKIEVNNFIEIIKANVRKVRKSLNFVEPNEKPPYFVGLFGIIPLIGAFVGLIILLTGIFKYKNIGFSLIGIAGIAFSILVFSGVLTPKKEKEDPDKMTPIVKERMSSLIKDIEYYKIEYGSYPDSLAQINSFQIYDLAQSDSEKLRTFVYHVEGERYLLFSAGYDRIENTKDDIYPEISRTSKVGLKKFTLKK